MGQGWETLYPKPSYHGAGTLAHFFSGDHVDDTLWLGFTSDVGIPFPTSPEALTCSFQHLLENPAYLPQGCLFFPFDVRVLIDFSLRKAMSLCGPLVC